MPSLIEAATEARDTFRRMLGRLVENAKIDDPAWLEAKLDLLAITQKLTDAIEDAKRSNSIAIRRQGASNPVVMVELRGDQPPIVTISPGFGLRVLVKDESRGYQDEFRCIEEAPGFGVSPTSDDGCAHA